MSKKLKLELKCRVCGENDLNKLRKTSNKKGIIVLDRLCKNCFNKRRRDRHKENKENDNKKRRENYKIKKKRILKNSEKWRMKNRDRWLAGRKKYYADNSETILVQYKNKYLTDEVFRQKKKIAAKKWRIKNLERARDKSRKYYAKNKERISSLRKSSFKRKANKKVYTANKRKTDIQYRLRTAISVAICEGLNKRGGSKNGRSCLKYLPYTIGELKFHIETLFEPWMIWENRGVYRPKTWDDNDQSTWKWQLDHIIPHSTFNYSSMEDEEFNKCWALSNLRPYSAKLNVIENNRSKKTRK